jgi:uncharacterized membrane protein
MVHLAGYPLTSTWLLWSIILFFVAGAAWLPVVWMQIQMRRMAQTSLANGSALPDLYWTYLRGWVALGIVAFVALVIVFYLMVLKPA